MELNTEGIHYQDPISDSRNNTQVPESQLNTDGSRIETVLNRSPHLPETNRRESMNNLQLSGSRVDL
jgi:hypothetical protein